MRTGKPRSEDLKRKRELIFCGHYGASDGTLYILRVRRDVRFSLPNWKLLGHIYHDPHSTHQHVPKCNRSEIVRVKTAFIGRQLFLFCKYCIHTLHWKKEKPAASWHLDLPRALLFGFGTELSSERGNGFVLIRCLRITFSMYHRRSDSELLAHAWWYGICLGEVLMSRRLNEGILHRDCRNRPWKWSRERCS